MRTKIFDQIKPYCYILTRLSDGKKYHGLRWDNVAKKRTPNEDFGIFYFTSRASLKKEFKNNKDNFKFRLTYTFDNKKEAQEYEAKFNKKILNKPDWLNQSAYPHLIQSEDGKARIRAARLGSKQSKETIKKKIEATTGLKRKPRTKLEKIKISEGIKRSLIGRNVWNKGKSMSEEAKKKLSIALKGRKVWNKGKSYFKGKDNPFYGKKHSNKTLAKIILSKKKYKNNPSKKMIEGRKRQSEKMKGRHYQTKESKTKISQTHLGNKYNLGRKISKSTREKISKGNKGKKRSLKLREQISESLKKYYQSKKTT
jgi:hypothetical protein